MTMSIDQECFNGSHVAGVRCTESESKKLQELATVVIFMCILKHNLSQ